MRITERLFLVGSKQLGISGPWDSHVYLIKGSDGLVLIDAGGGGHGEAIVRNIETEGLNPRDVSALLITHNHFDHSCGAAELREFTNCEVYMSAQSRDVLEHGTEISAGLHVAKELGIYPPEFQFRNCRVDRDVNDGDVINVAGLRFEAISVEGHSPDSICYLTEIEGKRHLFPGDVLFYGGVIGLINFPGSTMDGYRRDLKKLADLKVDGLFPGHMLFSLANGQQHINAAIEQCKRSEIPQTIGQFGHIF